MSFRSHTPTRRNITTKVSSHSDHKGDLRQDFLERCGYCNALDRRRIDYFHVDHFIPQNPKNFTHTISSTAYYNLVYACGSCNRAKSNKWPTDNPAIPNQNDEGFIDPCDADYNRHFSRAANGEINHKTNLGKWMFHELKLHKPQHEFIWNIEELENLIDQIEMELQKNTNPDIERAIKDRLLDAYRSFRNYLDLLSAV